MLGKGARASEASELVRVDSTCVGGAAFFERADSLYLQFEKVVSCYFSINSGVINFSIIIIK